MLRTLVVCCIYSSVLIISGHNNRKMLFIIYLGTQRPKKGGKTTTQKIEKFFSSKVAQIYLKRILVQLRRFLNFLTSRRQEYLQYLHPSPSIVNPSLKLKNLGNFSGTPFPSPGTPSCLLAPGTPQLIPDCDQKSTNGKYFTILFLNFHGCEGSTKTNLSNL